MIENEGGEVDEVIGNERKQEGRRCHGEIRKE